VVKDYGTELPVTLTLGDAVWTGTLKLTSTDRFLTENEMKNAVEVKHFADRAEFDYVVGDPDNEEVFYYYYTIVMKGKDCIWIIQMGCYEAVAPEYASEFDKWAASIKVE